MTNPPKHRGTAAETAAVRYLLAHGVDAKRVALKGNKDEGDLHILGGRIVAEVKSRRTWQSPAQLDKWMAEADKEASRVDGCDVAALIVKRPGSGAANVGDWFVTLRLADFLFLATGDENGWVGSMETVTVNLAHFAVLARSMAVTA
jgi:hypothetical protein